MLGNPSIVFPHLAPEVHLVPSALIPGEGDQVWQVAPAAVGGGRPVTFAVQHVTMAAAGPPKQEQNECCTLKGHFLLFLGR